MHLAKYKKKPPEKKKKVNLFDQMSKRKKKKVEEEEEAESSSEEKEEEEPLDPNAPRPFVPKVTAVMNNDKAGKRALLEFAAPRERGARFAVVTHFTLSHAVQRAQMCCASRTTSS